MVAVRGKYDTTARGSAIWYPPDYNSMISRFDFLTSERDTMPDINAIRALINDLDGRSAALRGYL